MSRARLWFSLVVLVAVVAGSVLGSLIAEGPWRLLSAGCAVAVLPGPSIVWTRIRRQAQPRTGAVDLTPSPRVAGLQLWLWAGFAVAGVLWTATLAYDAAPSGVMFVGPVLALASAFTAWQALRDIRHPGPPITADAEGLRIGGALRPWRDIAAVMRLPSLLGPARLGARLRSGETVSAPMAIATMWEDFEDLMALAATHIPDATAARPRAAGPAARRAPAAAGDSPG